MFSHRVALVLFVLTLPSCSLHAAAFDECKSTSQCRETFGLGYGCGPEGYCSPALLARCVDTEPPGLLQNPELSKDYLLFGGIFDRSFVDLQARENSVRLAIRQVNLEGGLDGRKFGAVFCDDEPKETFDSFTRTEADVRLGKHLAEVMGVSAIVGPAASSDVQAMFLEIRDTATLVISPSATSPALRDLNPLEMSDDTPGLLWRTAPPDSIQGAVIAQFLADAGIKNVAVIHQTGSYGDGLSATFVAAFEAIGGKAILFPFGSEEQRYVAIQSVIDQVEQLEQVLFVSHDFRDAVAFLEAVSQSAVFTGQGPGPGIFLTDSAAAKTVLDSPGVPLVAHRIRGTRPAASSGGIFNAFVAAYQAEYGAPASQFSFTAHAYDAAWFVFYGTAFSLLQEGSVTGPGIARGLRRLSSGDGVEIRPGSWNQVVENMRAGRSVNVRGASGELDYDPATQETSAPIEIWKPSIKDGEYVVEVVQTLEAVK